LATPTPQAPTQEPSGQVINSQEIAQAMLEFDQALVQRFGASSDLVRMIAEAHLQIGTVMLTELGVTDLQALVLMRQARANVKGGG
jgi:hypothetical protein